MPPSGRDPLSFTDAAELILRQSTARQPMHYRDITAEALRLNLIETQGLTPEATMYAQIIQECQRRSRRGERLRFDRLGKGIVGLTSWAPQGLAADIDDHNRKIKQALHQQLRDLDPTAFEELIGQLLAELGFADIEVTQRSSDGGIDVRGTLVVGDVIQTRMAVQVKRWKTNVRSPTVREVRGSLGAHEQGLIISTAGFAKGAIEEAQRPNATPIGLMDGQTLVDLLVEHDLGTTRSAHHLLELTSP